MTRAATIKTTCTEAATFLQHAALMLLSASSPNVEPERMILFLERAFSNWRSASERMAALEALAPNSATEGYAHQMELREVG